MAVHGVEAVQQLSRLIDDTFPSMKCSICYGSKAFPQLSSKEQNHEVHDSAEHRNNASFFKSLSLAQMVSPMWKKLNAPMIDFIFIVDDPKEWHQQNMSTPNYYHYSVWLRLFGSPFVSFVQSLGPGVLYNPFIAVKDHQMMIKYGVITTSQLVDDLVYWRSLYIAGRLHKPVLFLNDTVRQRVVRSESMDTTLNTTVETVDAVHSEISDFYALTRSWSGTPEVNVSQYGECMEEAMMLNLDYAVRVALIMLAATDRVPCTLKELFLTIASLSYCGDNRHQFYAEDNHKFEKIVNGSYDAFIELYAHILKQYIEPVASDKAVDKGVNKGVNADSMTALYALRDNVDIEFLAERLPDNLMHEMVQCDAQIMEHLGDKERVEKCVYGALSSIVGSSSWIQTVKGFFSSGVLNSCWYLMRKLSKYFQSVDGSNKVVAVPVAVSGPDAV